MVNAVISISLCGWNCSALQKEAFSFGSPENVTKVRHLLSCSICHRQIPIWDFLPIGTMKETCRKRRRMSREGKEAFDPIQEHRPYCLWIRSETSARGSSAVTEAFLPGWQITLSCLLGASIAHFDAAEGSYGVQHGVNNIVFDERTPAKLKVRFSKRTY